MKYYFLFCFTALFCLAAFGQMTSKCCEPAFVAATKAYEGNEQFYIVLSSEDTQKTYSFLAANRFSNKVYQKIDSEASFILVNDAVLNDSATIVFQISHKDGRMEKFVVKPDSRVNFFLPHSSKIDFFITKKKLQIDCDCKK